MTAPGDTAVPWVAVVGCGYWGRNLVRNFHALGALAAVCDEAPAQARSMAERYQVGACGFADALAESGIDAVVLATPAETHAALAIRAIEAGKHVFVEKPLALDVTDASRVAQAAATHGRVLMVGHLLQYHPAFLKLKDIVASGVLGRLNYVYSNRLNLGRIRREEDVFWSLAPHDISMILALVNEVPDQVEAIGHCYLHGRIADVTTTHLRFPGGANAHVFVSWLHPNKEQKLIVVGNAGMAIFDDCQPWSHKLVLYPHQIAWQNGVPEPTRAEAQPVTLSEDEPLRVECQHFLDCIGGTRHPRTDAREAINVLRVLDGARRSMATGHAVTLIEPIARPWFAHDTACIDAGCEIGERTRIWNFSHVLKGSRIGRDCVIGQNVMVGPDAVVGDGCKVQNNVSIYNGVTLEDYVFCGPSCVFTNVINPRAEIERKQEFRPTWVGRGATIGANATIICGHRLGAYCFIAAGAVVTSDVPAHALMAGNPARRIGWMSREGYRMGDDLTCPKTGERYMPDGAGGLIQAQNVKELV